MITEEEYKKLNIGKFEYSIHPKLLIKVGSNLYDYDGSLSFTLRKMRSLLEIPIRFNEVFGNFDCRGNNLINLDGCPNFVSGDFDCEDNHLTTLKGAPEYVGGDFDCEGNQLTSLDGGVPIEIGGNLYVRRNPLITNKIPESLTLNQYIFMGSTTLPQNLFQHMKNLTPHSPHQLDHHLSWLQEVDPEVYSKVIQVLEKCGMLNGQPKKNFKDCRDLVAIGVF